MSKLLAEAPLQLAKEEAAGLRGHLQILNAGLASSAYTGGFSPLKRKRTAAPVATMPTEDELRAAAAAVHGWLQKPASPLRAILTILCGKGVFFAAHVVEKKPAHGCTRSQRRLRTWLPLLSRARRNVPAGGASCSWTLGRWRAV